MKKTIFISNRQSGKSHIALYEFLKDPDNCLFIGHNNQSNHLLLNKDRILLNKYKNSFKTEDISFIHDNSFFRGKRYNKIIIDEYFLFEIRNQIRLYKEILNFNNYYNINELLIFSTSRFLYNEIMFNIIKDSPKIAFDRNYYDFIINKFLSIWLKRDKFQSQEIDFVLFKFPYDTIEYMFYNFLTDNNSNIINYNYFLNRNILDNEFIIEPEKTGKYIKNENIEKEYIKFLKRCLIYPSNLKLRINIKNNNIFKF